MVISSLYYPLKALGIEVQYAINLNKMGSLRNCVGFMGWLYGVGGLVSWVGDVLT